MMAIAVSCYELTGVSFAYPSNCSISTEQPGVTERTSQICFGVLDAVFSDHL